jgi:hypothetical protein
VSSHKNPHDFASEWKEAFNSHDLERFLAFYSEDVIFKSPRVRTMSEVESGVLRGKAALRNYWRRLLELRPNLECSVGHVFAGVDSVALEYRFPSRLHGIEFMTIDSDGLVAFAVGNDLVR